MRREGVARGGERGKPREGGGGGRPARTHGDDAGEGGGTDAHAVGPQRGARRARAEVSARAAHTRRAAMARRGSDGRGGAG